MAGNRTEAGISASILPPLRFPQRNFGRKLLFSKQLPSWLSMKGLHSRKVKAQDSENKNSTEIK